MKKARRYVLKIPSLLKELKVDYASQLNTQQLEAVTAEGRRDWEVPKFDEC